MAIIAYSHAESTLRDTVASPTSITGTLYLAAPMQTYHTEHYDRALALVGDRFPNATIISAHDAWASNADWLARWPRVLARLSALVLIADDAGWIGRGVWREYHDARALRVPCWHLAADGRYYPPSRFAFSVPDKPTWRQFARVVLAAEGVGDG